MGVSNKRAAEAMGDKVDTLVSFKLAKQSPDRELTEWLETCPAKLQNKLADVGLIGAERAAGSKPLEKHLEDFRRSTIADGHTGKQAQQQYNRVSRVFTGCAFTYWTEISANKLQQYIFGLRNAKKSRSGKTANFYLQACKQFCGWMIRNRRAGSNPLEHLQAIKVDKSETVTRRALELDEIRILLETTNAQPKRSAWRDTNGLCCTVWLLRRA